MSLHCRTRNKNCCESDAFTGSWFFPNGTKVPNNSVDWDYYSSNGSQVVDLNRKKGGVSGIYHCRIPGINGEEQDIYVGIYNNANGELK